MTKLFSKNKYEYLLTAFFILSIIPFIILHFFNHPTPEDLVWTEETKSFGYFNAQDFFYRVWSGRFFSYSLLSLNPLFIYSITGYRILLILMMTGFVSVMFLFVSEIFQNSLSLTGKLLITFSVLFLYLFGMSSVSQGFYWLTSVFIYHLGLILILLFLVIYLKAKRTDIKKQKIFFLSVNVFILLGICGTNELTSITLFLILIFIFLADLIKSRRIDYTLVLFLAIIIAGAGFSFLSPGNASRAERNHLEYNFIYAAQFSLIFVFEKIIYWIFLTPLIPVSMLILPLFMQGEITNPEKPDHRLKYLIIQAAGFFMLIFILVLASFLSTGESLYGRAINYIYFIFLGAWFTILYKSALMLKQKRPGLNFYPKYIYVILLLLIIPFMLVKNNLRTSYSELFRGRASEYNDKLNKRYEYLKAGGCNDCEVDSIKNIPKTYFLYDITSDTSNHYNKWYARYFKKNSVRLK